MRERELKHKPQTDIGRGHKVAPHAGARIETRICVIWRGNADVAPHAGARIETQREMGKRLGLYVAPHAGARIETILSVH